MNEYEIYARMREVSKDEERRYWGNILKLRGTIDPRTIEKAVRILGDGTADVGERK